MDLNNSELIKEIQSATKIQTMQGLPRNVSNQIVPVIEVNPKAVKEAKVLSGNLSNSLGTNIFTTPINQDVYITSINLSVIKDAGNNSTNSSVTATINGLNLALINIAHLAATAQSASTSIVFPHPVKIDRNVNVRINTSDATANIRAYANVSYFIDEASNG